MAKILLQKTGVAGAGIDESYKKENRLYEVLEALVDFCADTTAAVNALRAEYNDVVTQFNTLKGEYDAETVASHTDSAATDLVATASSALTVPVTKE
jgi:hypothetical protein